ncbi:MAG: hypothetical protein WBC70_08790 [Candidatus Aminicenantales bacterium]
MRKRLPDLTSRRYLFSLAGQTARRRGRSKLLQLPLDFLYESRFENEHGFFRPIIKEVVERYFDCSNPRCGRYSSWISPIAMLSSPSPRCSGFSSRTTAGFWGELCRCALRSLIRYFEMVAASDITQGL